MPLTRWSPTELGHRGTGRRLRPREPKLARSSTMTDPGTPDRPTVDSEPTVHVSPGGEPSSVVASAAPGLLESGPRPIGARRVAPEGATQRALHRGVPNVRRRSPFAAACHTSTRHPKASRPAVADRWLRRPRRSFAAGALASSTDRRPEGQPSADAHHLASPGPPEGGPRGARCTACAGHTLRRARLAALPADPASPGGDSASVGRPLGSLRPKAAPDLEGRAMSLRTTLVSLCERDPGRLVCPAPKRGASRAECVTQRRPSGLSTSHPEVRWNRPCTGSARRARRRSPPPSPKGRLRLSDAASCVVSAGRR